MEQVQFSKKYNIVNEVLNAVTHGVGCGLSIAALVVMLIKAIRIGSPKHIVAYAIYGGTLIMLFLFSTLYHSLIFTKAKKVFQTFDHDSIFLLIAGTYTPYCLLALKGWMGIALLIAIWVMAVGGIVYKSITLHKQDHVSKVSTIIYIIMGWLCILAIYPLYLSLGVKGIALLISGGVAYTVGSVIYSFKSVKFVHVVWHFFVLLGAILMFFSIYLTT